MAGTISLAARRELTAAAERYRSGGLAVWREKGRILDDRVASQACRSGVAGQGAPGKIGCRLTSSAPSLQVLRH